MRYINLHLHYIERRFLCQSVESLVWFILRIFSTFYNTLTALNGISRAVMKLSVGVIHLPVNKSDASLILVNLGLRLCLAAGPSFASWSLAPAHLRAPHPTPPSLPSHPFPYLPFSPVTSLPLLSALRSSPLKSS